MATDTEQTTARSTRRRMASAYGPTSTAVAIALLSLTHACSGTAPRVETDSDSFKQSVATQKRINRYFHEQVVPKLRDCWNRIQGAGAVDVKYSFVKDDKGRWVFERLERGNSTLPAGQDPVALTCMQEATAASSFAYEEYDGKSDSFVVIWTWPVPLPPNIEQQADAMFRSIGGTQGGGCDGEGTPARCLNCYAEYPVMECRSVCVGYDTCSINHGGGFRWCTTGNKCASGGPFGLGGGIVMQ